MAWPLALRAQAPSWVKDSCAGLDCGAVLAGVGEADFIPEARISSAVAYAQAARSLSLRLASTMTLRDRQYAQRAGEAHDSAVKDWVESPMGMALTKAYAENDSDVIDVTIELKRLLDKNVRVYAQEFLDPASGALAVRLVMNRSASDYFLAVRRSATATELATAREAMAAGDAALEAALGPGFSRWMGATVRLASQDIRVGKHNEFTLLVETGEDSLTWVEHWPSGGADLLRHGEAAEQYAYDNASSRWTRRTARP
jgi:Xaa-Pro aminopeptidase